MFFRTFILYILFILQFKSGLIYKQKRLDKMKYFSIVLNQKDLRKYILIKIDESMSRLPLIICLRA